MEEEGVKVITPVLLSVRGPVPVIFPERVVVGVLTVAAPLRARELAKEEPVMSVSAVLA